MMMKLQIILLKMMWKAKTLMRLMMTLQLHRRRGRISLKRRRREREREKMHLMMLSMELVIMMDLMEVLVKMIQTWKTSDWRMKM